MQRAGRLCADQHGSDAGGRASDSRPRGADAPAATITAKGDTALVSALLVNAAHADISPSGVKRKGSGHMAIQLPGYLLPLGTIAASGNQALATVFLAKNYTIVVGSSLEAPIGTVTAQDHHILVTSNLVKLRGTSSAAATGEPLGTISAQGQHHSEVRAFLLSYYGVDQDPCIGGPLATIASRDRFGLVTIHGQDYQIVDIGLRMLAPSELYRTQGFPADYIISEIPDPTLLFVDGKQTTSSPLELPVR